MTSLFLYFLPTGLGNLGCFLGGGSGAASEWEATEEVEATGVGKESEIVRQNKRNCRNKGVLVVWAIVAGAIRCSCKTGRVKRGTGRELFGQGVPCWY